jgi:diadenosine tetraphosphate (Ap4A) HIT family hydrolase
MDCEYFDKLNTPHYGDLLFETAHWQVLLAPDQRNLGTCVVALKREEKELSGLRKEEWSDLLEIVKELESALKKAFHSTMFNWGCLMNSSYLEDPPRPHLHWHFIPRYRNLVKFNHKTFYDPCFGQSTMHNREELVILSKEFRTSIKECILDNLNESMIRFL